MWYIIVEYFIFFRIYSMFLEKWRENVYGGVPPRFRLPDDKAANKAAFL
jgi:hypothetical protein